MSAVPTPFRYRLQRVLQLRAMETAACADHLRLLAARLHQLGEQIDGKRDAIRAAQQNIIGAESKSGSIDPGLRMRVTTYIELAQQQQQALVTQRGQTSLALAEARSALRLKRQALRGLEIHRQHGSEAFKAIHQRMAQLQEDELWLLIRPGQRPVAVRTLAVPRGRPASSSASSRVSNPASSAASSAASGAGTGSKTGSKAGVQKQAGVAREA